MTKEHSSTSCVHEMEHWSDASYSCVLKTMTFCWTSSWRPWKLKTIFHNQYLSIRHMTRLKIIYILALLQMKMCCVKIIWWWRQWLKTNALNNIITTQNFSDFIFFHNVNFIQSWLVPNICKVYWHYIVYSRLWSAYALFDLWVF